MSADQPSQPDGGNAARRQPKQDARAAAARAAETPEARPEARPLRQRPEGVTIAQSVAILIDGNNIERSIQEQTSVPHTMLNFDTIVPRLLDNRGLNRLVYFREGRNISSRLSERLYENYHGSVRPCHKSADIPLTIKAMQLASKVDTIIIMSGDSDYVELVRHLKTEGVRVEIAAIPATTSQILREEADYFHEITREDWFSLPGKKGRPGRR